MCDSRARQALALSTLYACLPTLYVLVLICCTADRDSFVSRLSHAIFITLASLVSSLLVPNLLAEHVHVDLFQKDLPGLLNFANASIMRVVATTFTNYLLHCIIIMMFN